MSRSAMSSRKVIRGSRPDKRNSLRILRGGYRI